MRVSEAFAAAGSPGLADYHFHLTCDECGTPQHLAAMELAELGDVTTYACRKCAKTLVGVKTFKPDAKPRPASGYRLADNVVGSKVDLFSQAPRATSEVRYPATPNFFT